VKILRFVPLLVLLALPALAQDVPPAPVVDQMPTSVLGWVFYGLVALGGLAITAAFGAVGLYFARKAQDGAAWSLANRLWVAMQNAVTHAEAEIRPDLQKALADGKLTPEEAAQLKTRALQIFKQIAGDLLEQAPKVLGFDPTGLPSFLSGLLERAVVVMKGGKGVSTQIGKAPPAKVPVPSAKEAAAVVKAARANPPADSGAGELKDWPGESDGSDSP